MGDNESAPFSATCPKCKQLRYMDGYTRAELRDLLATGDEIEGYCQQDDYTWVIDEKTRAGIAKGLAEGL